MDGWIPAPISLLSIEPGTRFSAGSARGVLLDVGESTNKQRTLNDYLDRAAIFDHEPRGGGMALIFATEMAGLK